MTERERAASAETDLERAAREYALVVRRVRTARAGDAAGRRGAVEAVLGAHTKMFSAAMGYRSPPGRIAPETELERAAAAMARDAARDAGSAPRPGAEPDARRFLRGLHDAAMAAYDPRPAAAAGYAREPHGPDETIALRSAPRAGGRGGRGMGDGSRAMYRGIPLADERRPGRCAACGAADARLAPWTAMFADGVSEDIELCAGCAPIDRLTPGAVSRIAP